MEYLVSQNEMKQYDRNTIEFFKIPSIVLMERAALASVLELRKEKGEANFSVLVVAGCGNNGGDGFAVGRLLALQGCHVDFVLLGSKEKCTEQTALQMEIVKQYGYDIYDKIPQTEYDIVIDAIFGIGLSRTLEGKYLEAVKQINESGSYICALDIPSGVHADSGQILGCAVKADLTVTYGFYKVGQFLYPGTAYCGKIICAKMGIDDRSFLSKLPECYTYTSRKDVCLPKRKADGNKGTFGKVLVIAGSDTIGGAAILAGKSAFYTGCGMIKIVTAAENKNSILQTLPEAMLTVYEKEKWLEEKPDEAFVQEFDEALKWADCILIGPGIGTSYPAKWLLQTCLQKSILPMVIDADGLNLLAKELADTKSNFMFPFPKERNVILTPHLGEFARLYGCSISQAKENLLTYPQQLANRLHAIVVCKDARSVVAMPDMVQKYVNLSGNSGMATAGSGDVLAGIITGFLAQGMDAADAAVNGVYLHGLAGDKAAERLGERSMLASDIIEEMKQF